MERLFFNTEGQRIGVAQRGLLNSTVVSLFPVGISYRYFYSIIAPLLFIAAFLSQNTPGAIKTTFRRCG